MPRKRPHHHTPYRRGPYCFQHGKKTYVCDVIWMQTFGAIPQGMRVTHRNGNTFDNRPGNLQLARIEAD
jgi:hypothetical protein